MVGGEPESRIAHPIPALIAAANERLRALAKLPVETHCPAFSARVSRPGHPGEFVQLAKVLQEHTMNQFDVLYYPRRAYVQAA